jgi:hypothetical protein
MPLRLKVFVIIMGVGIFLGILELVRRRKLREEYSFIWLFAGFVFVILAMDNGILVWISQVVEIAIPVNTLFFLALMFVMLLLLYFSLRISALTTQVKNLAQQLALLQSHQSRIH